MKMNNINYLCGIDIGTGGAKIILVNAESGKIDFSVTKFYDLHTPKPLWAEQEPTDWWGAVCEGLQELTSKIDKNNIKAVGLTGQMHSSVFLDKNNNSIREAILWCDQRTAEECEILTSKIGKEKLVKITCNPMLTGFTAPKIEWLKRNEKENFEKIKKILLPKDYIRFLLTGEYATDVSDASGMGLFDVPKRCFSKEILSACGYDRDWFGESFESSSVTGTVTKEASEKTGLPEGIPVIAGGGDNAASAIGNTIVEEGKVFNSIGTSGVVFAYADKPILDPKLRTHTFCHAVPGKWHIMGVMLSAGGSLKWYKDTFCDIEKYSAEKEACDVYDILNKKASQIPIGCEGLTFLPYLSGERCPYPDPYARGCFFGMTLKHTRDHFTRSVFEGISFGLNDSFDILKEMKVPIKQAVATGGGARSDFWKQMLADITGIPHATVENDEGPSYGAALLAGVGCGIYSSVIEASKQNKIVSLKEPKAENTKLYQAPMKIYKALYPKVESLFKEI